MDGPADVHTLARMAGPLRFRVVMIVPVFLASMRRVVVTVPMRTMTMRRNFTAAEEAPRFRRIKRVENGLALHKAVLHPLKVVGLHD